jgi:Raf kinase inhibitor-like YbhB/YbcL family protein
MRDDRVQTLLMGVVLLVIVSGLTGCTRSEQTGPGFATSGAGAAEVNVVNWNLTSSAFAEGERVPTRYTGDGENLSPPLEWTAPPEGTVELVLICNDPDAPRGDFTHWLAYGMAPDLRALPEGISTDPEVTAPTVKQGNNSAGSVGYTGPKPPPGPQHRYQFILIALKEASGLEPRADRQAVERALQGKELGRTTLQGVYSR